MQCRTRSEINVEPLAWGALEFRDKILHRFFQLTESGYCNGRRSLREQVDF